MDIKLIRDYSEDVLRRRHENLRLITIEEETNSSYYFADKLADNGRAYPCLLEVVVNEEEAIAEVNHLIAVGKYATFSYNKGESIVINDNMHSHEKSEELSKIVSRAKNLRKSLLDSGMLNESDLVVEDLNISVQ